MPHRAGYFALAYSWDHHCEDLMRSLQAGFAKAHGEVAELMSDAPQTSESLLNYYKKWHYNRDLYGHLLGLIGRKIFTINSLGYRGYGVNQDLAAALSSLEERERGPLGRLLDDTFLRQIDVVRGFINVPQACVDQRNSEQIIGGLCTKLGLKANGNIPCILSSRGLELDHYYKVMSSETSWQTNTAIFQRLFFRAGSASATLMEGSAGLHNQKPARELKTAANENFRKTCQYIFGTLDAFTPIGLDLLKDLHGLLCLGLDPEAGQFRRIDFPDRNGVTLDFGNFDREIGDLAWVLSEAAASFHDLPAFIYNLARCYHMFIGIHPFWDSNGRVGRTFLNQMFMKKGLPPVGFCDSDEIFALPRYGGTIEDMHEYLKARIMRGVSDYFYERTKLQTLGLVNVEMHNVSFDSGFTFSQIEQGVRRIEVQFEAFIIAESNPLAAAYRNSCRVVVPDDFALYNITMYCGLSDRPRGHWAHTARLQHDFHIAERDSEMDGIRVFDVECIVGLGDGDKKWCYFNCSVAYEQGGLLFNNKGLNYCYRLVL